MPLTPKGQKIKRAMVRQYGEEKGEHVLYASENAGTISGIHKGKKKHHKSHKRSHKRSQHKSLSRGR